VKFWTTLGKVKQVLTQLGIYFSVISMLGIAVTAWHTTISPILVSYGIVPSPLWLIFGITVPFVVLGVMEWKKGMSGFYRSFAKMFYTSDSELKMDISELKEQKKDIEELKKQGEELKEQMQRLVRMVSKEL